ncbi:MAG: DNA recombination protein RmuC [Afipia sp.]|jgi:DNA recombination protein RmuC|nr:MAG: DNA recombination protein RmuC [Afipia sp.]
MAQAVRADELEERLAEVLRMQSESTGRVHEHTFPKWHAV